MTSFQRRVVHALLDPVEPAARPAVQAFVETSLGDMPHHLRLGIDLDSILLEALTRATHGGRIPDDEALRDQVVRWESNPLTPIRQYARLLSSLVLFGDQENRPAEPIEPAESAPVGSDAP
jgi:hypothetical protein